MGNNQLARVLILGVTGMLGNAMYRFFVNSEGFTTWGTARSPTVVRLARTANSNIIEGVDVSNTDVMTALFSAYRPDIVINCIGIIKQISQSQDPLTCIAINSLLPHRLSALCAVSGARFIHISTDCVFSGDDGDYQESDPPDATDLYGRSKLLGEVEGPHAVTLRTSIIGRELGGAHGLIDWFLSQKAPIKGFRRAFFSGLPTCELARVVRDYVIPGGALNGLYHVSGDRIDKYSLLKLVAERYGSSVQIDPSDELSIDRSLNSSRFKTQSGYRAPPWPELIAAMHAFG